MRVGPKEGPLVAAADARRLVHLIVVLDHLEELLVDQVRLLLLLLLLLPDELVELVNVDIRERGLQAISSQARILIYLEIVGESVRVLFHKIHGLVLVQELRILPLLLDNLHLCSCCLLVLVVVLADVVVLRCTNHSVRLHMPKLFLIRELSILIMWMKFVRIVDLVALQKVPTATFLLRVLVALEEPRCAHLLQRLRVS